MDRTWSLLGIFRGSNAIARLTRTFIFCGFSMLTQTSQAGIVLEGQNKGDTAHWYAGNLQSWQELDYIPCRVHFSSAQGSNQAITIFFEHRNNNVPGIENLFYFTASNNVVLTATPLLSCPAGSSTWSYTLTVNVLNNQDGYIWFSSRLAAGAHLNVGSSLHLTGNPSSMGTLQIHKPQARTGKPNLAVFKKGPTSAAPGDQITYTLTYSNRLGSTDHGTGVQLSDILPSGVTVNGATLATGGLLVGNTIYWDLPDLNAGVGGTITFQALIATNVAYGSSLTNYGQILSAENDSDYSDNESTWITTLITCNPPLIVTPPANQTNCPGTTAMFSTSASGTGIGYQWYKGTAALTGETGPSLIITNVNSTHAGVYSVVVSGVCGNSITNSAALIVNELLVVATAPANQTNCPGTTAIFAINATGTGVSYQWYKGSTLVIGETGSSLVLTNVSLTNAGIYSVVVSGTCSTPITNSAALVVSESVIVTTPPSNQTNCPGTTAMFSTSASGTGIGYQWYKGNAALTGETGPSLIITNVNSTHAGVYSVTVSGVCGNSITNSATLVVNDATTASPLANAIRNPGESVTFPTIVSGTGPFTYLWKKSGTIIPGATTNSLTLSNLIFADAASYSVEVSGACNTAIQSATLAVNHPPTVEIFTPTNGAIFIAPATFTLGANATDTDGVVTNVEFFLFSTNKLGETTNSAPASLIVTNLAAGSYTFSARATDDLNAHGTSTSVTISIVPHLPLTITSSVHFNPQTGLFEQTVRVFNPTYSDINAIRVYVSNIDTNTTHVYNASGFLNGMAYVESYDLVNPGFYSQFVIEYYVPTRVPPNAVLTADLVPVSRNGGSPAVGTQQHIDRGLVLFSRFFLVEFLTVSNRLYSVQYSPDLRNWRDAQPAVRGNGTRIQWLDDGEPKTVSDPDAVRTRFYRVMLLP